MNNLIKKTKVLFPENSKTLPNKTEQCPNKWKGISCLWIEKLSEDIDTIQKNIHSIQSLPKVQWYYFLQNTNDDLQVHMESHKDPNQPMQSWKGTELEDQYIFM